MNGPRALQLLRLVLGGFFVWRSWEMLGAPQQTSELLSQTGSWAGWPLIGHLRPLELTFVVAFTLFLVGVFLMGGLLVRVLSVFSVIMALASFGIFGPHGLVAHTLVLIAAAIITLRGGGAGTMDSALGAMQRRSLEREAEREAARRAARAVEEQDASGASA